MKGLIFGTTLVFLLLQTVSAYVHTGNSAFSVGQPKRVWDKAFGFVRDGTSTIDMDCPNGGEQAITILDCEAPPMYGYYYFSLEPDDVRCLATGIQAPTACSVYQLDEQGKSVLTRTEADWRVMYFVSCEEEIVDKCSWRVSNYNVNTYLSSDEKGLPVLYFFAMFLYLVPVVYYVANGIYFRQFSNKLHRRWMFIFILGEVSLVITWFYWMQRGENGQEEMALWAAMLVTRSLVFSMTAIMFMFIGEGWCIVHPVVSRQHQIWIWSLGILLAGFHVMASLQPYQGLFLATASIFALFVITRGITNQLAILDTTKINVRQYARGVGMADEVKDRIHKQIDRKKVVLLRLKNIAVAYVVFQFAFLFFTSVIKYVPFWTTTVGIIYNFVILCLLVVTFRLRRFTKYDVQEFECENLRTETTDAVIIQMPGDGTGNPILSFGTPDLENGDAAKTEGKGEKVVPEDHHSLDTETGTITPMQTVSSPRTVVDSVRMQDMHAPRGSLQSLIAEDSPRGSMEALIRRD
eukprot:Clim_evm8s210 gene=Clim_evmTU8s210